MKNTVRGYKIDFATNTLYMNYKFASAAAQFGTDEYKLIQDIRKDFPNIRVVTRAGRNAKTCNANKRLTYANMVNYIRVQDNVAELMAAFAIVKEESKCEASPYAFVRNWFVKQFPNYQKCKVFDGEKIISFAEPAPNEEKVS